MKIEVNGEVCEVEFSATLNSIVTDRVSDTRGIAVAINNSVVSKAEWDKTTLKENDKVLLITATQGG